MIQFAAPPGPAAKDFFRGEFASRKSAQTPTSGDSGPCSGRRQDAAVTAVARGAGRHLLARDGAEAPDFSAESRVIALTIDGRFTGRDDVLPTGRDTDIYIAINGGDVATAFLIPRARKANAGGGSLTRACQARRHRRRRSDRQADHGRQPLSADSLLPFALVVLVTEA